MKKTSLVLLLFSFCLSAADFWQSKPAAEWSDKDLQKMMTNSPWAKSSSVAIAAGAPRAAAGRGGGRGGGTMDVETTGIIPPNATDGQGGGGGARGGRGGGGGGEGAPGAAASVEIVARWQSALPLKQALMRLKFGAEAGTSPQAKAFLDQVEANYVLILSGPMLPIMRARPEALKTALMNQTSLTVKGKDPLKPTDAQISGNGKAWEMVIYFSRSVPFTLDDKEVEFATQLGAQPLKYKFRLKDMVVNGKLEL